MKRPKQNNEATGSTRRLLHYRQVSGKEFPPIFGNFEVFIYYSTISRATPDDILRNPGWETLNSPKNVILASSSSEMATFTLHALANSFHKCIQTYFILIFNIKLRSRRDKDNSLQKGEKSTMYI